MVSIKYRDLPHSSRLMESSACVNIQLQPFGLIEYNNLMLWYNWCQQQQLQDPWSCHCWRLSLQPRCCYQSTTLFKPRRKPSLERWILFRSLENPAASQGKHLDHLAQIQMQEKSLQLGLSSLAPCYSAQDHAAHLWDKNSKGTKDESSKSTLSWQCV